MIENVVLAIVFAAASLLVVYSVRSLFWAKKSKQEKIPYIEALNAIAIDDVPTALSKLREAVKMDSQNVDAYIKLGDLMRHKGNIERALRIHKSLTVRSLSAAQRIEVLKALTADHMAAKNYQRASELIEEILSADRKDIWALQNKVRVSEEREQWDDAFDTLKQWLRIEGREDNGQLALHRVFSGLALDQSGEHHKARLRYKEALRLDERCTPAYLFLGDSYVSDDRLDEAVAAWKKLIDVVPEHAYLGFERVEGAHFEMGDYSAMVQMYQDLIDQKPDDLRSLFALVKIKEKMGATDEAIALCQQALERDPESRQARWNLVRCHHARGDDRQAVRYALELEKNWKKEVMFRCSSCGFQSKDALWRCPQCKSWKTFV